MIEINGLGKKYSLRTSREPYLSIRDQLSSIGRKRLSSLGSGREDFWAVRDLTFSVDAGDAVGIIGRNGAGKSTLLKLLSQITLPSEGSIKIRGRVASLLEVGTGFHPELSGKENIYLNGSILGMTRREISSNFDAIVSFAEVERFLETPVKRYSSGMYVRLAFAVAAHLSPEVMIVDEVLAVGDATFQKKCLGKMGDVAKSGRTVLFVSHNMAAVSQLCTKGILMNRGRIEMSGDINDSISAYLAQGRTGTGGVEFTPSANEQFQFRKVWIEQDGCLVAEELDIRRPYQLCIEASASSSTIDVEISAQITASSGNPIFLSSFSDRSESLPSLGPGLHSFRVEIPELFLAPGTYYVSLLAHVPNVHFLDRQDHCLSFSIAETGSPTRRFGTRHFGDVIFMKEWTHEVMPSAQGI